MSVYMHGIWTVYGRLESSISYYRSIQTKLFASAGNRTRAARVAGEHSTTEPPMLMLYLFRIEYATKFGDIHLQLTIKGSKFKVKFILIVTCKCCQRNSCVFILTSVSCSFSVE